MSCIRSLSVARLVLDFPSLFRANPVDISTFVTGFPLSLADDARRWWIDEGDGKITTWEELVEKFFCKFYPLSRDGVDEMLNQSDNRGVDPLEFISRVNSIFKNRRRVDERTKKALLNSWINGSWNKERMDDIVSSDDEWEESYYGNPPNTYTNTKSLFKPYLDAHKKVALGKRMNEAKRNIRATIVN
ncbi:hypothetical protein Tco_0189368 [Tanacetum coccineum]